MFGRRGGSYRRPHAGTPRFLVDNESPAPGDRADRAGSVERRAGPGARDLTGNGEGALRRAAAKARRPPPPPDPARVPPLDRTRPAREEPRVGEGRQRGLTESRARGHPTA